MPKSRSGLIPPTYTIAGSEFSLSRALSAATSPMRNTRLSGVFITTTISLVIRQRSVRRSLIVSLTVMTRSANWMLSRSTTMANRIKGLPDSKWKRAATISGNASCRSSMTRTCRNFKSQVQKT